MATQDVGRIDSLQEMQKERGGKYSRWQMEIQAAEKELDKWQRRARRIVKEYRAEQTDVSGVDPNFERRFNLFSANVHILQTALLNQTPQVTVNREFKDITDDVARVACRILERAIQSHNGRNFNTDTILKQALQDMLVPGMGISWHTYYAEIVHHKEEMPGAPEAEAPTPQIMGDVPLSEPPEPPHPESGPQGTKPAQAHFLEYDEVVDEKIVDEYVYWQDLLWSPARTYEEVRWMARKTYLTRDKLVKRFGEKVGKAIPLNFSNKKIEQNIETKHQVFQQAIIYEIWDKEAEKIIWWNKDHESILDEQEDFLELDGFFPCPRPMFANTSNGQYIPIPDYEYARDQYRELNEINTRIALLVKACRVAGAYDKAAPQLASLLTNAAENTLVPVDSWAAFAEKGGMKGAIEWLPLEQIVVTIEQLTKNREDVKNQIYEITGMADIIRGASKASETLGAQKIKAQYASMRIQERQKNVVHYSSAVFDLQCQIMRKHMDPEVIAKLAQVQFMNEPPELVQAAMELVKQPDFLLRARVESDTLSDIDFQAEKQDRMEYMTTITNYLKEVMPTMTGDPIMGPFLMQLLQFSLAGFKVGKQFEGELDQTFAKLQQSLAQQPPEGKQDPKAQEAQAKMQLLQQKGQLDQQKGQQALQAKGQELEFKKAEGQMKLQQKREEMAMKGQEMQQKHQQQREQMAMDQQAQVHDHQMTAAAQEAEFAHSMRNQNMEMGHNQRMFDQQLQNEAQKAQQQDVIDYKQGKSSRAGRDRGAERG